MRRLTTVPDALIQLWERQFKNDTSKFYPATFLQPEDLGREFADTKGDLWNIVGSLDGKEMACRHLKSGHIYIWDRWKISNLIYSEKHTKATKFIKDRNILEKLGLQKTSEAKKKRATKKSKEEALIEEQESLNAEAAHLASKAVTEAVTEVEILVEDVISEVADNLELVIVNLPNAIDENPS